MAEPATWTIRGVLDWTRGYFEAHGIDSPRLDAEVLLAEVLGSERIYLYTHHDQPLDEGERAHYRQLVKRRASREPVAYILGRREFFSRDFRVSRDVLVPRPETEHLVECVLTWAQTCPRDPQILDLGCGSGNIAVTLACELPRASVVATDVSPAALRVAQLNVDAHRVGERVELLEGDLFAPLEGREPFDAIVSNPPYVESTLRSSLQPEIRDFEPTTALFAGVDGMSVLDRLCAEVLDRLRPGGLFACEMDAGQCPIVMDRLRARGRWSSMQVLRDLQGLDRVVAVVR